MVEVFKQSHRNLGANFISRDSEEREVQSGDAQSGPPAASGPKGQPSAMNEILWKQYSITTL